MGSFEKLDKVKFPARVRLPDGAPLASWKPWHNYVAKLAEEPDEQQVMDIVKETHRKARCNSGVNARWDEIYRTDTGWEVRYGFGTAEYVLDKSQQRQP